MPRDKDGTTLRRHMITLHEPTTEVKILNPEDAEYSSGSYLICEEWGPWYVNHSIIYADSCEDALNLFLDVHRSSKIDETDLPDYQDENGEVNAYWHDELGWCDIGGIMLQETAVAKRVKVI